MTEIATSTMQRSQELIDTLKEFYRAAREADMEGVERLISHHPVILVIGTDPQEWWSGPEEIRRIFVAQTEEMGGFPLTAGNPVAYVEGTMGWFADRPTMNLPDGSIEFRVSGVAHREDDAWKLVHLHLSIGVPNEEALGQDLTV